MRTGRVSDAARAVGFVCLLLVLLGSLPPVLLPNLSYGAEPVRLTSDGRLKFSPVFFKGGEEVVYADLEKPELYRLQRLTLKTPTVEPLHPKATTSEFEPAVSADGRFYAFLRTRGTLSVGVVVRNIASGAEVEVPPGAGFSGLRSPA